MSQTLTVRLSWVTYVRPVIQIAVLATVAFFYVASFEEIRLWVTGMMPQAGNSAHTATALLPLILFMIGIFKAVWKILLNRSAVLTIEPDGVSYRGGILPWKRWERYWRYHQIFNVLYSNNPEFLGWLLRFGDLIIVGREGSTQEYRISGIHDPRRAQITISNYARG